MLRLITLKVCFMRISVGFFDSSIYSEGLDILFLFICYASMP